MVDTSAERIESFLRLAKETNAEKLFVVLFAQYVITIGETISEFEHGVIPSKLELLGRLLFPLFDETKPKELTPAEIVPCFHSFERACRTRFHLDLDPTAVNESETPDLDFLKSRLELDATFIRGDAYAHQTEQEILDIQGRFESWFQKKVGVGPARAVAIVNSLYKVLEEKGEKVADEVAPFADAAMRSWKGLKKKRRRGEQLTPVDQAIEACGSREEAKSVWKLIKLTEVCPDFLPLSREDVTSIPPPSEAEWNAFRGLIGFGPGGYDSRQHPALMQETPLWCLSGGKVLLLGLPQTMDALWSAFERVAQADRQFFDGKYSKKKGEWLELQVVRKLERLFPKDCVYRKLSYPDPDKLDNPDAKAELDVAVLWPPFLIFVEAKAKQYRLAGRLGDLGRLRTDVKANVEDAFSQARRAGRYIEKVESPEFVEQETKRVLKVSRASIRRLYFVAVSQQLIAGVASSLASVRALNLFREGEYPWAISIADLDVVTEFSGGPDVLLHYIERRLAIQQEDVKYLADEIDFFGAYLDTRLQPLRPEGKGADEPTLVVLGGFQEKFDQVMDARRAQVDIGGSVRLRIPPVIEAILRELRTRQDEGARWIAFSLLAMSDGALDALDDIFKSMRSQQPPSGVIRRTSVVKDDVTIVVLVGNVDEDSLVDSVSRRLVIEKYRNKTSKGMGFGVLSRTQDCVFDCAVWGEGDWVFDPELDRVISAESSAVRVVPSKPARVGRNDPCPCGSGKKLKFCCRVV